MSVNPPTAFKASQRSKEILYFFCGTISQLKQKHGGYNEENKGFTSLHSKYLKQIHVDYRCFLDYLVSVGVLEQDGIFHRGSKSKGYKYSLTYTGVPLKSIELKDYLLRKGIKKQEATKEGTVKKNGLNKYMHIVKWFIDGGLEIDRQGALNWIEQHYKRSIREVYFSDALEAQEKRIRIKQLYEVRLASEDFVNKLAAKGFKRKDFVPDPFGNRLHGMFTYQSAGLRSFITYKGHSLVSSDVKNSQPYFSLALLEREFWMSKKAQTTRLKWSEINEEMYRYARKQPLIHGGIKWLDSSTSLIQRRLSMERFREDVVSGRLYERFKLKLDSNLSEQYIAKNGERVADRQRVKKQVLKTLYSHNSWLSGPSYEPSRVFETMYPDVIRFFKALRSGSDFKVGGKTILGYKFFPLLLQQIESYCMLKLICGRIAQEKPDLPIFTIHDSIVTTQGNEEYVQRVMKEVLRSKIGVAPQIKTEVWTTVNLQ